MISRFEFSWGMTSAFCYVTFQILRLICCDDQWVDMEEFETDRRAPEANWNTLICCVGQQSPKEGGNCAPVNFTGTLNVGPLYGFDEFNVTTSFLV